jgi:hypothetical protein
MWDPNVSKYGAMSDFRGIIPKVKSEHSARHAIATTHPDLKHTDKGTVGTYISARIYYMEFMQERDELLDKYKDHPKVTLAS